MLFPDLWRLPNRLIGRAYRRSDHQAALSIARRYASLRPRDPKAWVLLARVLSKKLLELRDRVALDDLKSELADVYVTRCHYVESPDAVEELVEEAERLYRELHEERPTSVVALLGLATIAHGRREWPEVERLTAQLQRMVSFSEDPESFQHLITILAFVPGGERHEAQALLRRALEIDPKNASYRVLLALLIEEEDPTQAAQQINEAQRLMLTYPWDEEIEKGRELLSKWGPEWWDRQP